MHGYGGWGSMRVVMLYCMYFFQFKQVLSLESWLLATFELEVKEKGDSSVSSHSLFSGSRALSFRYALACPCLDSDQWGVTTKLQKQQVYVLGGVQGCKIRMCTWVLLV